MCRFANEIAAAIKIQSLGRRGIAWNKVDERRFQRNRCVPVGTVQICSRWVTVISQMKAARRHISQEFVFPFANVIPQDYCLLKPFRDQLVSTLDAERALRDRKREVPILKAMAAREGTILAATGKGKPYIVDPVALKV